MNKTKRQARKRDALEYFRSNLVWALTRQARTAEKMGALYERALALQEQALRLQTKSTRAAQEMVEISKRNYAQRLLTAVRAATTEVRP